ncbi:MAG: hypothetical protein C4B57_09555 [Deltaproteobacteria bacterium]|nr:MAG: hypothetical protein C4B57_09555 [Deltaproteobacteria bacterium]
MFTKLNVNIRWTRYILPWSGYLFSGFQSSLIADRRGSAIWPAIETLQKANRFCGRARMATSTVNQ